MDGKSWLLFTYLFVIGALFLLLGLSRSAFDKLNAKGLSFRRGVETRLFGEPERSYEEEVAVFRKLFVAFGVFMILLGVARLVGLIDP